MWVGDVKYNSQFSGIIYRSLMIVARCCRLICHTSSIKQSLRVLELNTPTSKSEIKKKYLIMAKKYHPDSTGTSSVQAPPQNKQHLEEKFVSISKAYQYLRDLSEDEINLNKQKQAPNPNKPDPHPKRRKTVEEVQRQQTYDYFNRKYYQQAMNNAKNKDSDEDVRPRNHVPLYKSVPELFLGFLLLAVLLGDWTYRVYKRKERAKLEEPWQNAQEQDMGDVFKKMNHNAVFAPKRSSIM